MKRHQLAERYQVYTRALQRVADSLGHVSRTVAELTALVDDHPRERIPLELARAEIVGYEAHLAALQERIDSTRAALMAAICKELPDENPEAVLKRLAQ